MNLLRGKGCLGCTSHKTRVLETYMHSDCRPTALSVQLCLFYIPGQYYNPKQEKMRSLALKYKLIYCSIAQLYSDLINTKQETRNNELVIYINSLPYTRVNARFILTIGHHRFDAVSKCRYFIVFFSKDYTANAKLTSLSLFTERRHL